MMRFLHKNSALITIMIISVLFCLDLFIRQGRPSAFDGPTHLANIAQFTAALRAGDFPVRWMGGFANYGMPMGVIVQQTTSYLGALFNLIVNNTVLSYNLVVFVGTFFSLYFLYLFLRCHFSNRSSILGVILFAFAPYRIINVYIRGALPEYFAHVFFPLILMGLYCWIAKRDVKGLMIFGSGLVGILLTHPFTLVIGSFLFVPYALLLLTRHVKKEQFISLSIPLSIAAVIALGISAYYILPLFSEIKYFYYGRSGQGLLPGQDLSLLNYLGDHWNYFTKYDIDVRGHVIHLGLLDLGVVIMGMVFWLVKDIRSRVLPTLLVTFGVLVFFTTKFANPIYTSVKFLGGIQHNWRMFTSIVFIAPLIGAYIHHKTKSLLFFWLLIGIVLFSRVPQLYGKNYLKEPDTKYYWNKENLHGNILNTIWTGPTQDYPVKKEKGEIIAGKGAIVMRNESNSVRTYTVRADTEVRMADNTFYFPGWRVYVDGVETLIEFQDMNYRGVITYNVSPGTHTVVVRFTNTKIRLLGNSITVVSLITGGALYILWKRRTLTHHSA